MRFIFYKNNTLLSRFVCMVLKEDCSHVAIDFGSGSLWEYGPFKTHKTGRNTFITKNKFCCTLDIKTTETQNSLLAISLPQYDGPLLSGLYRWLFKKEKTNLFCTSLFRKLPPWLIFEKITQTDFGLITPCRLYKLILEHIREDTVKVENTKQFS